MAKAITKAQLAHLRDALNKQVAFMVKANSVPVVMEYETVEEKIALILAGFAVQVPAEQINGYTRFFDAYKTPGDILRGKLEKENLAFKKQCEENANAIYEKAVFMGAEEAFAALQVFRGE